MSGNFANLTIDARTIVVITADMIAPGTNLDIRADAVLITLDKPPTAEQATEILKALKRDTNNPANSA